MPQTVREIENEIAHLEQQIADAEKRKAIAADEETLTGIAQTVADARQRFDAWIKASAIHATNVARLAELRQQESAQAVHLAELESELKDALAEAEQYPDSMRVANYVSHVRNRRSTARDVMARIKREIAALESEVIA